MMHTPTFKKTPQGTTMELHGLTFVDPWGEGLAYRARTSYGAVNLTRVPNGWRAWVVDAEHVVHGHNEASTAIAAVQAAARPFDYPF